MSRSCKLLLLCSSICYLLVLYGFLFSEFWILLIFFILFSIAILSFCLLSLSSPEQTAELERTREELSALKDSFQAQHAALSDQLQALTEEKERYSKAMTDAISQRDAANEELALAISQKDAALEQETASRKQQLEALETFLPPLDPAKETREVIDIIKIARETVAELTPFARQAKLQIQISAPEGSLMVRADASRLHILFRNIIDNSIKYMKRAGMLVITISSIGDDIFIVLKDNGLGLPETETEHIFELNYQGSNRISGNGLGLTQAKAIVSYYGGTIYAKSTCGKGMGIYVQLPTL